MNFKRQVYLNFSIQNADPLKLSITKTLNQESKDKKIRLKTNKLNKNDTKNLMTKH